MASRKEEIRMQRIALRFLSGIFMASEQELPAEVGKSSIPRPGAGDASTLSDDAGLDVSGIGTKTSSVGSGAGDTSSAAFSSGAFAAVSAGPTLLLPSVDEFLRGSKSVPVQSFPRCKHIAFSATRLSSLSIC